MNIITQSCCLFRIELFSFARWFWKLCRLNFAMLLLLLRKSLDGFQIVRQTLCTEYFALPLNESEKLVTTMNTIKIICMINTKIFFCMTKLVLLFQFWSHVFTTCTRHSIVIERSLIHKFMVLNINSPHSWTFYVMNRFEMYQTS